MSTSAPTLGRLVQVDLREVWTSEHGDFTPWLAQEDSIELLGQTIGLNLEVEAQEKDVGPFRADILCKDVDTEQWVLIENQLERTDHGHLGQLLTYAAGLKAVTIVWIARQFTDEHRAALDWLNEITDQRFQFFGLEVEAWRIGASLPAPKFNVVCKPNDWSKRVLGGAARVTELTEARQLQLEFWSAFRAYAEQNSQRLRPRKPLPWHAMTIALGRSGFHLAAVAPAAELRAEFVIVHAKSAAAFETFAAEREVIEKELGEPLTWYSAEGVNMRRIFLRRDADLEDRSAWPEYCAWLTSKLDKLHEVFQPRARALDLDAL